MIKAKTCLATTFTAAFLIGVVSRSAARGGAVPDVDVIRQRYVDMRQKLSEFSVKWALTHQLLVDKEKAKQLDKLGSHYNSDSFNRIIVHTAFKDGKRFYDQSFEPLFGDSLPVDDKQRVMASDGQFTRMLSVLKKTTGKAPSHGFVDRGDILDQWTPNDSFMSYHGLQMAPYRVFVSDDCKKLASLQLDKDLVASRYHVAPSLEPAFDGAPSVVVSSEDERLWFDPALNCALRERQWTGPGNRGVVTRLRFSKHEETRPGLWMARRIDQDFYCDPVKAPEMAGKPYRTEILEVFEMQTHGISDELFTFAFPPGCFVTDTTLLADMGNDKPFVNYFIPANADKLPGVVARATEETRQFYVQRPVRTFFGTIAFRIGVVITVVGLIVVIWRQWSVRRSTKESVS